MKMIKCNKCNIIEVEEDQWIEFKVSGYESRCRMQLLGFPTNEIDLCVRCLHNIINNHFVKKINKRYPFDVWS